jgi:uncharacterized protein with HEPN domain
MSKRDSSLLLEDIMASVDRIEQFTQKHDVVSLEADVMAMHATLHNLAIIGEAAKQIPDEAKNLMPAVVWKDVIGLRNIIIHKYFEVDPAVIWKIVTQDLPALKLQIQAALDEINNKSEDQSPT